VLPATGAQPAPVLQRAAAAAVWWPRQVRKGCGPASPGGPAPHPRHRRGQHAGPLVPGPFPPGWPAALPAPGLAAVAGLVTLALVIPAARRRLPMRWQQGQTGSGRARRRPGRRRLARRAGGPPAPAARLPGQLPSCGPARRAGLAGIPAMHAAPRRERPRSRRCQLRLAAARPERDRGVSWGKRPARERRYTRSGPASRAASLTPGDAASRDGFRRPAGGGQVPTEGRPGRWPAGPSLSGQLARAGRRCGRRPAAPPHAPAPGHRGVMLPGQDGGRPAWPCPGGEPEHYTRRSARPGAGVTPACPPGPPARLLS
jgi:hypothetical protein